MTRVEASPAREECMSATDVQLVVERLWDGAAALPAERATVTVGWRGSSLRVQVDAPDWGDAPPAVPAGSTDRLWEHEVVELFLLREPDHYLELELGPHGHHLALELLGCRQVVRQHLPIAYRVWRHAGRWGGVAFVDGTLVPRPIRRGNAYAIHGEGKARRFLACYPVPGTRPDFHQLEHFQALALGEPSCPTPASQGGRGRGSRRASGSA
jgi:hypothetical protein